ncbi:uncharacterized protein LOC123213801 [Mangifera indica]|uniref:uncharacterized protein LOC123213801 n=1 Tax=Mangifera indica TaxID=29780 RepID=UPI001CFB2F4E|nr:uncharacterized protein LOC123213801 [Mangifera indica]
MELPHPLPKSRFSYPSPSPSNPSKTLITSPSIIPISKISRSLGKTITLYELNNDVKEAATMPTMSDILASSRAQNLDLLLQTFGPFFRITARSLETQNELGRAEGLIRVWLRGRVLHLDSIRLRRETLGMERSIFGIGLFVGAAAVRYGYDCGCGRAELLAINDSDLYHNKLVRFYKRIGFKVVHEVTGSTIGDWGHMLVWGGIGTRMEANVEELLMKWCRRFKSQN